MATDIYVGVASVNSEGQGSIAIYYHVPVPAGIVAKVAAALGPQTPSAYGVPQERLDAFAACGLREVATQEPICMSDPNAISAAQARVRAKWADVAADEAARLTYATQYFGVTLARA